MFVANNYFSVWVKISSGVTLKHCETDLNSGHWLATTPFTSWYEMQVINISSERDMTHILEMSIWFPAYDFYIYSADWVV